MVSGLESFAKNLIVLLLLQLSALASGKPNAVEPNIPEENETSIHKSTNNEDPVLLQPPNTSGESALLDSAQEDSNKPVEKLSLIEKAIENPLWIGVTPTVIAGIILALLSFCTKKGRLIWSSIWRRVVRRQIAVPRNTIRIVPTRLQYAWDMGSSKDGPVMCLHVRLHVTNIIGKEVLILRVFMRNPFVEAQIVDIGQTSGAYFGYYPILPGKTATVRADFTIKPPVKKQGETFITKFVLVDQYNNRHKTSKVSFPPRLKQSEKKPNLTPELVSKIIDPTERIVVSLLQAELYRYQQCGRSCGGLGSVTTYDKPGVGTEMREAGSYKLQCLSGNGRGERIRSDNAQTLIELYRKELSEDVKKQVVDHLLLRLSADGGYSDVAYLILLVLFRIDYLKEALEKAKCDLQNSRRHGFSDFLRLLDGLMRIEHAAFSHEMTDHIEKFIEGTSEHTLRIPERLASIRTQLIQENH